MHGDRDATIHARAAIALMTGLLLATVPAVSAAPRDDERSHRLPVTPRHDDARPGWLPPCSDPGRPPGGDGLVLDPWRTDLDDEGVVTGHRLTLRRDGADVTLRTGPRGFALPIGTTRLLLGERSDTGTRVAMIDVRRGCRLWMRQLDRLAYLRRDDGGGGEPVRLALHEPATRLYEGTMLVDPETGASGGMIDGECITECEPNDGDVTPAAYEPAGAPRPVPNFAAGGWPGDKKLRYRWHGGQVPPTWAKDPLRKAAEDARRTSGARSPRFIFDRDASDSVRYTPAFPTYCRTGIACAARAMPSFWAVWLRPHGTDFAWGTLGWCQKRSVSGCFDIRRVMLHELGHIAGLHHPSTDGSPLAAHETVMHAITPSKPRAGSGRHAFGRCDVATLQELYDTPNNKTPISTCNDVATDLALNASRTAVDAGGSVTLIAELRVARSSAYRQLSGNPLNGRSVKLKYRRAGSDGGWQTAWMRSTYSQGRYELSISPQATWEFKAVFPSPDDEGLRYSRSSILKVKVQ